MINRLKFSIPVTLLISFASLDSQDLSWDLLKLQSNLEKLHYELLKISSTKIAPINPKDVARDEILKLNISDDLKKSLLLILEGQPAHIEEQPIACPKVSKKDPRVIPSDDELQKQLGRASSEERQQAYKKLEKDLKEKKKRIKEEAKNIKSKNRLVNSLLDCITHRRASIEPDEPSDSDDDSDWGEEEGED